MIEFRCKHCGSLNLELEEKGNQTGLYCCDCGKWLKWVTKEEKRVFNNKNINCLEKKANIEKELEKIKKGAYPMFSNASREAMGLPPIKPQGILILAKSNDTMLDVARNVIKAVETTVEVPTGLRSLTVNREQETKDRIQELIGYLNNYVEWR